MRSAYTVGLASVAAILPMARPRGRHQRRLPRAAKNPRAATGNRLLGDGSGEGKGAGRGRDGVGGREDKAGELRTALNGEWGLAPPVARYTKLYAQN